VVSATDPSAVNIGLLDRKSILYMNKNNNIKSSSYSFLLGLGPAVCLYQSSSDVDVRLSRHNKSVRYPRPGLQFLEHLFCLPVGRSLAFPTNPPRFIRASDRH
jgi:hypothetical protein